MPAINTPLKYQGEKHGWWVFTALYICWTRVIPQSFTLRIIFMVICFFKKRKFSSLNVDWKCFLGIYASKELVEIYLPKFILESQFWNLSYLQSLFCSLCFYGFLSVSQFLSMFFLCCTFAFVFILLMFTCLFWFSTSAIRLNSWNGNERRSGSVWQRNGTNTFQAIRSFFTTFQL